MASATDQLQFCSMQLNNHNLGQTKHAVSWEI